MYENQTFEAIQQRELERVRLINGELDTREGSIIQTSTATTAVEHQNMYIAIDAYLNESFVDTQSRPYLIRRCAERKITPKEATKAIRKGQFNIDVPIGSRYSLNALNYVAVEKIKDGVFQMECETAGTVGNAESGSLIPIQYVDGLTSAVLTDVLIPGEDEEATEALRQRYYDSIKNDAFGGNIADYRATVKEIPGVGDCKVTPVWAGGGTVLVTVISSAWESPSEQLKDLVQDTLDPTCSGEGYGTAPIGHVVTVAGVSEQAVNISLTLGYETGVGFTDVQSAIAETVKAYLLELSQAWADNDHLVVRISQLEARILELPGIIDIADTKINGKASNLNTNPYSIPVLGEITETEV